MGDEERAAIDQYQDRESRGCTISLVGCGFLWSSSLIVFVLFGVLAPNLLVQLTIIFGTVGISLIYWRRYFRFEREEAQHLFATLTQLRQGYGEEQFIAAFPSDDDSTRAAREVRRWLQYMIDDQDFPVCPHDPTSIYDLWLWEYEEIVEALLQGVGIHDQVDKRVTHALSDGWSFATVADLVHILLRAMHTPAAPA